MIRNYEHARQNYSLSITILYHYRKELFKNSQKIITLRAYKDRITLIRSDIEIKQNWWSLCGLLEGFGSPVTCQVQNIKYGQVSNKD